jgi:phosphoribosylaminoimidazolecarboxamide formyltransferase/IMP cyclohydrolase
MLAETEVQPDIELNVLPIRRALISVSDKSGLDALAKALAKRGVELYSTGGTERYLRELGVPVQSITSLTNAPEVFDGRLKTLHPMVHGGLLYRRDLHSHIEQADEQGIVSIDLLIVNLYPFEQTVAKKGATKAEIIEQIDIGGPAMLRSAAKNFSAVTLLTDASQYDRFLKTFEALDGSTDLALREDLAREGFQLVARYDRAIVDYFNSLSGDSQSSLIISLPLAQSLRYGENPHQKAALYGSDFSKVCTQLWGKELSYNNILDMSAALGLIAEFMISRSGYETSVAAIIKHTNPCGVAEGLNGLDAFNRAFTTDPESPFGGIIALNVPVDAALAERLNEFFSEVILAPAFNDDALEILKKKKDRRLIQIDFDELRASIARMVELRSVIGGVLEQNPDQESLSISDIKSVTTAWLAGETAYGLLFANKIVKHLKSNAIAFCGLDGKFVRTLGLGAGQTSRVESVRIAVEHAKRHGLDLSGSFIASDAFFPFADGLIEAANAGAVAAIEPGGSVRDAEVIQAAEERGMALVMTGMRHFKH